MILSRPLMSICTLAAALGALAALPAHANDKPESIQALQVTDPYLEMHTGPGRGFPVFHVAARGESVSIVLRHTDWFKVRTAGGKEGWVQRKQLESTLTQAGEPKRFRDVLVDDYLRRRFELGAAVGRFGGEPALKVWSSWRLAETISIEGTIGQVQGLYSGTDFWHLNLHTEPWGHQRLSPTFGIGFGRFNNLPNTSLVGALPTDAKLANATIGLRWFISDRFVARADYSVYTAYINNTRSGEYRSVKAGLSFFF